MGLQANAARGLGRDTWTPGISWYQASRTVPTMGERRGATFAMVQ